MASDAEIAWLAGILEGEGSFMMTRNRKVYRYPKIIVNMTDRDIIERVAALFRTGVYDLPSQPNRLPAFRTQISGARAAVLMTQLRPWLGSRRRQRVDDILDEYGKIEPTNVRRARACSVAQKARWAIYGTREGKLSDAG